MKRSPKYISNLSTIEKTHITLWEPFAVYPQAKNPV